MKLLESRLNRNLIAAVFDSIMAALSFLFAVYIRLGEDKMIEANEFIRQGCLIFTGVCILIFVHMRFYRGLWRYASLRDVMTIIKSVTLAIILFAALMFVINRLEGMPRSIFFINWMLLISLLVGPRFLYRAMRDKTLRWEFRLNEQAKIPVLIIGANSNTEQFIREMSRSSKATYEVVGIVDDDPRQKGRSIHQVMIYGGADALPQIVKKLDRKGKQPQKLILADDGMSGEHVRELLAISNSLGIPMARLPRLSQFKSGISEQPEIKPIAVEDLLGRAQNVQNRKMMRQMIEGKTVLVTGAGGSIGSELARQIAGYAPLQLLLLESSEHNLYQIERELRGLFPDLPLRAILGDVRNTMHINTVFMQHKPQLVLHAAAIKHVPLSECNIEETILTNVFGTQNVAAACVAHQVDTMVMISTDKAVNPTNVMGASKRLAESICQALGGLASSNTKFVTVRFGNVLGSTGSVVPLFQEQIAKGGPLTVTHPEMTRYFMTIREAVELVLHAATLGQASDRRENIFVLDMGKPVKILDLAMQMIRLAGLQPEVDIKIVYTGLRPGEKLYEELFHCNEASSKTDHESIFLASPRFTDMASLRTPLDTLCSSCEKRDTKLALSLLKQLVPEFTHD